MVAEMRSGVSTRENRSSSPNGSTGFIKIGGMRSAFWIACLVGFLPSNEFGQANTLSYRVRGFSLHRWTDESRSLASISHFP